MFVTHEYLHKTPVTHGKLLSYTSSYRYVITLSLSLLIYYLQSEDWIKNILYAKGLSKGMQATQSVKWNEMYKWKDDMIYPGYEPEQLCAQG